MGFDNPTFSSFAQSSPQIFSAPQTAMKSAQDIKANQQKITSNDLALQLQQALQPVQLAVQPYVELSKLPASKTSFTTDANGGIKLVEKAPPTEMVKGKSAGVSVQPAAQPAAPGQAVQTMGPQPMAPQAVQPIILNPAAGAAMMGGMSLDDMVATIMQTGQLQNSSFITGADQKVQDALAAGATAIQKAKAANAQKAESAEEKARLAADSDAARIRQNALNQTSKGLAAIDDETRARIFKDAANAIKQAYAARGFRVEVDEMGNVMSPPVLTRKVKTNVPQGAAARK